MARWILLWTLVAIPLGCQNKVEFNEVKRGRVVIQVADYLSPTEELASHKTAVCQFANPNRGVYLLVMEGKKLVSGKPVGRNLNPLVISQIGTSDKQALKVRRHERDGLSIIQTDWKGTMTHEKESVELFYKVTVVESKKYFYKIYAWTLWNRKEHYEKDLQLMVDSFREVN